MATILKSIVRAGILFSEQSSQSLLDRLDRSKGTPEQDLAWIASIEQITEPGIDGSIRPRDLVVESPMFKGRDGGTQIHAVDLSSPPWRAPHKESKP